jgi:hypothetical protein
MSPGVINRTIKEAVRHLITRSSSARLFARVRRACGQDVDHLFHESLAERFSAIYDNRAWLNGRESGALSGIGSEITNTEGIRKWLPKILVSLSTGVLLDVGCGDFTWMKDLYLPCKYIGVDIVPGIIAVNSSRYGSGFRHFAAIDATRDPLPQADTVLCRDILMHLSFRDIWCLLEGVRRCGASFFIATSDNQLAFNADILSGDFRMLNLRISPFYFPEPEFSVLDNSVAPDRLLSVWSLAALPPSRRDGVTRTTRNTATRG